MGRAPCCEKVGLRRGRWTAEEDKILSNYIQVHGEGSWRSLPKKAGLLRCGKSCRLRWINYLRSDVKRGNISAEEENLIMKLHATMGNRWSLIAGHLAGRTDNEIKNYWNSHLSRKIYPTSKKQSQIISFPIPVNLSSIRKRTTLRSKTKISPPESCFSGDDDDKVGGTGVVDRHKDLILDPANNDQVLSLIHNDKQVNNGDEIKVVESGPLSSSTTMTHDSDNNDDGKQVDWDLDLDLDLDLDFDLNWDFEGGNSMISMVDRWLDVEEEDNNFSWPWDSPIPNNNDSIGGHDFVEIDMEKQDAMIAWLLS